MEPKNRIEKNFLKFPYELFNVVFSRKSFIDINRLNVHDEETALSYMKNYGYDITDPLMKQKVVMILQESKNFIQNYLLEDPEGHDPALIVPPEVLFNDNILDLLIMASEKEKTLLQIWACAVLRVAHTITHVENDLAKSFMPGIKKQIFSRFMDHLKMSRTGEYYLGEGDQKIQLKMFEMKNEKSRESLILKLLHKKENVTADVFDRIGVRVVTYTKLDVILVLKYFSVNHVVSFANIKPSRTRNNLINVERFLQGIEELNAHDLSSWKEEDVSEFLERHLQLPPEEKELETDRIIKENNLYSSTLYSSLQLTGRQLITIKDFFKPEIVYRFFFPFEIQILDEESFNESREGRASHEEYKKNQICAARKRVLNNVIKYQRQHLWKNDYQGGEDEN
ncbi:MAG TPA: TIGR04552 family protein [bacterium]|nr:TIGR04552 family protein [bacterium]HPV21540.1 TIGR04552 family protein [bacterium]